MLEVGEDAETDGGDECQKSSCKRCLSSETRLRDLDYVYDLQDAIDGEKGLRCEYYIWYWEGYLLQAWWSEGSRL